MNKDKDTEYIKSAKRIVKEIENTVSASFTEDDIKFMIDTIKIELEKITNNKKV